MIRPTRLPSFALLAASAMLLAACSTPSLQRSPGDDRGVPDYGTAGPQLTPELRAAGETLERMAELHDRLYRVAAPLLIDNAPLCTRHARNLLGFTAKNRYTYPGHYNDAAAALLGMDERLRVTNVLAGSGAARAGLRTGDVLLAAGGTALAPGPQALSHAGEAFRPIMARQATLPLSIERDGKKREIIVPVTRACAFSIELGNADNVNAYADGQRVMVTRGMLAATRNDDELAAVVARTMAHNMLGHPSTMKNSGTLSGIIDKLTAVTPDTAMLIGSGGIKPMPATLDVAADRLAIYLLARANYRLDGVSAFWRRLADSTPASTLNGYTANHPVTSQRSAAVDKAVAEVVAKRNAGKPLTP